MSSSSNVTPMVIFLPVSMKKDWTIPSDHVCWGYNAQLQTLRSNCQAVFIISQRHHLISIKLRRGEIVFCSNLKKIPIASQLCLLMSLWGHHLFLSTSIVHMTTVPHPNIFESLHVIYAWSEVSLSIEEN